MDEQAFESTVTLTPPPPPQPPPPDPPPPGPSAGLDDGRRSWRDDLPPRSREHRVLAGVCAGVAERTGINVIVVRLVFVLVTATNGLGLLLYLAGVVFMPVAEGSGPVPSWEARLGRTRLLSGDVAGGRVRRKAVGVVFLAIGGVLLLADVGLRFRLAFVVPVLLAGAGLTLAWSGADEDERSRLLERAARLPGNPVLAFGGSRTVLLRTIGGAMLVVAGVAAFVATGPGVAQWESALVAAFVTAAGIGLMAGPWVLALLREVREAGVDRIRAEARGDMAAHLHDSVLQTLALVQRNPETPREVVVLARRQERELREWLYGAGAQGPSGNGQASLAGALKAIAGEVEAAHGLVVDVVTVGDVVLDERLGAVVAAARESLVNAARHAGVDEVSLYAEVRADRVEVFVRDRGRGFDPAEVDPDRHGVRESIRGRLRRVGGEATIVSVVGEGTEVMLEVPR